MASSAPPVVFRIGPVDKGYVYRRHDVITDGLVWRCDRPARGHACHPGEVLWIFQRGGLTFAVHAPATLTTAAPILQANSVLFLSSDPEVLTVECDHDWSIWTAPEEPGDDVEHWKRLGMFKTTILEQGRHEIET